MTPIKNISLILVLLFAGLSAQTKVDSPSQIRGTLSGFGGISVDNEVPVGATNGTNTVFTLVAAPNPPSSAHVHFNGLRMTPTVDYTISGANITMLQVPNPGDMLLVDYRK